LLDQAIFVGIGGGRHGRVLIPPGNSHRAAVSQTAAILRRRFHACAGREQMPEPFPGLSWNFLQLTMDGRGRGRKEAFVPAMCMWSLATIRSFTCQAIDRATGDDNALDAK
jgi:hypothetical protein